MVEYRVEEVAEATGITVELVRSYQSKGMLPPPRHEGRVAYYDDRHVERVRQILDLKDQGWSLRMIAQHLDASPTVGPVPAEIDTGDEEEERLTLRDVAERTRVPPSMLRSLEASGVLRPRRFGDEHGYTVSDVRAVRMLLSLLGSGLPMEEFMRVARVQLEAIDEVAEGALDLFLRYVRQPLLDAGLPEEEEAELLVGSFRLMLHATSTLIAYNFQRMVLNAVQDAIDEQGSKAEKAAMRSEALRRRLEVPPL